MTNYVFSLNLLHPNISIYILHTLLYLFYFGTDEENSFEDQSFLGWRSFPSFSWS